MWSSIRAYARRQHGAAAAEFGVFVLILAPLILNLVDMGYYAYVRMQVENAAQAGAQAAYANCIATPPSASCEPNLSTAIDNAVHGTSLGTKVSWTNKPSGGNTMFTGSSPKGVDRYCPITATNTLSYTNSPSTNCSSTAASPGYYAKVSVSYTYRPVFSGATIASLFPSTITATTYQRLY
ncbi:MAG TPA: TadE/TadG family type IV pilus assembly protein [Caulobacteraceae bacterium]|nr:TadE/TadG family type IV pilus assembly protein [Caulobacteraceae bacterium]